MSQGRKKRIRVAIAVADEALERFDEVVLACDALGFRGDSLLTSVGVLTGSIEGDRVQALRGVSGVARVEVERRLRIHTVQRGGVP